MKLIEATKYKNKKIYNIRDTLTVQNSEEKKITRKIV